MWKIVRRAAAGVATKESFPLGDDPLGFETRRKVPGKSSNTQGERERERERAIHQYLNRGAFGQARTLGNMHGKKKTGSGGKI